LAKNTFGVGASPVQLDAALARAGMTEQQYELHVAAILAARKDAAEPEGLKLNPELPAETLKELGPLYAVRRKNAEVVRRFSAPLNPLLSALGM
jgi:hypothetical protein